MQDATPCLRLRVLAAGTGLAATTIAAFVTLLRMALALRKSRAKLEHQNSELEAQRIELESSLARLQERDAELSRVVISLGEEERRTETLRATARRVSLETSADSLAQAAIAKLGDVAGAEAGLLYAGLTPDQLLLRATRGVRRSEQAGHIVPGEGLAGRAFLDRHARTDSGTSSLRLPGADGDIPVTHAVHIPLLDGPECLGVVTLGRCSDSPWSDDQLSLLTQAVEIVAMRLGRVLACEQETRQAVVTDTILDATPAAIALTDVDGRLLVANAQARRQLAAMGIHTIDSFADALTEIGARLADPSELVEAIERIRREPEVEFSWEQRFADTGRVEWVLTRPVYDATAALAGRIFVAIDVTTEREMERLKDEFLSTVSHELRTPLASIVGFSELLLTRTFDAGTAREFLGLIQSEATRLTRLIDDFLDLQSLERREVEFESAPFDLAEVVAEAIAIERGQSHTIEVSAPVHPVLAVADRRRVERVVHNLVANAIKYSPDGGTVHVEVSNHEGAVRVAVRDQGIGIPAGQQRRVFERFYRAESAATRAIPGAGVGLALCQRIVEALGGQIGFESLEGEGSTFWFTLPAAAT